MPRQKKNSFIKSLAILSGSGTLPLTALLEAEKQNIPFFVYIAKEENFAQVLKEADLFERFQKNIRFFSLTKIGALLKSLHKDNVSHLLLVGKAQKNILLNPFQYDLRTIRLTASLLDQNDNSIFDLLLQTFEKEGFKVLPQTLLLQSLLLAEGVYSKKKPTTQDLFDIDFGLYYAKKIGALDIGQTVVVAKGTLLAVEVALEGTDKTIVRGGGLAGKYRAVVCKSEKEKQDLRFDIPTVGLHTLQALQASGCKVLAVEAEKTFVTQQKEMREFADRHGLVLVSAKAPTKLVKQTKN